MRLCCVLAVFVLCADSAFSTERYIDQDDEISTTLSTTKVVINNENKQNKHELTEIVHFTSEGRHIDITLDQRNYNEMCYIQPPNGQLTPLYNSKGVEKIVSSDFISCGVTIGPIDEKLIGKWQLCGWQILKDIMRCQPVFITWNSNDGTGNWEHITEDSYTHPVYIGGSVNSGVSGSGSVTTCHVVTPAGEDLVITSDANYPHIERSSISKSDVCGVLIRDITEELLGDWVIYGRFRSVLGQSEVRLPLTFNLYDEDNPYNQAYNVTVLESQNHLVHLGTEMKIDVSQKTGTIEDCIYILPTGQTFHLRTYDAVVPPGITLVGSDTEALCQIYINYITEDMTGEWHVIGKFQNGDLFDEKRLTFKLIAEDPENPIPDAVERVIETVSEEDIITEINNNHTLVIHSDHFIEPESCHLITPNGLQYVFIPGFYVPGVQIIDANGVECGVVLNMPNEEMIGEWILMARATRFSIPIERRLYFNVRVEEHFIIQNDIHIKEGADLYLHLTAPLSLVNTCILLGPDGQQYTNAELDPVYTYSCGFIVRNVNNSHSGKWVIQYGDKIKNIGHVNVYVIDLKDLSLDDMQWSVGDSINITVGPKNAVYCVIRSTFGLVFDNFGQCEIVLDRVTIDHRGYWTVSVGLPGSVRLQEYGFYVNVLTRDSQPLVTTSTVVYGHSVMLSCSVPVEYEVHACKFRDPRDNILIAAHGVGEDGYMFNMSIANYESDANSHNCTLRLTNPSTLDLGIWRCALDTSAGIHYGFLTVVIPYLMEDPTIAAAVVTKPALKASSSSNLEGEPVTLSCSIPSPLRYCYFRARNGTVYNVFPRMLPEENFGYVGAGLDAGECGIRFTKFSAKESRGWTCHVGLVNTTARELSTSVYADVKVKMVARHYWSHATAIVVEARVYDEHSLDYCRFVRKDGVGFASDNLPNGYELQGSLHMGYCILYMKNPCINDLFPWTIAARLTGADGEVSITTTEDLFTLLQKPSLAAEILFWMFIISMFMIPAMGAYLLLPKHRREQTFRRANQMRDSFRNSWQQSFGKKPMTPQSA